MEQSVSGAEEVGTGLANSKYDGVSQSLLKQEEINAVRGVGSVPRHPTRHR